MIFGAARISLRELTGLSRRLSTALGAGIDVRKAWAREASGRGPTALRRRLGEISGAVAAGYGVAEAIDSTGEYFPSMFREMVHVGEESGQLTEIFRHLAEHYDHQLKLRRMFLASIAWPLIQLSAAIFVVGLLIWIMGMMPKGLDGEPIDILGVGLVGTSGLLIYSALVCLGALCLAAIYEAIRRGLVWTRPLQRAVLRIPVLGNCLETLAISRLAWSLHLTMETNMDLQHALRLSLRSTRNAAYIDDSERIVSQVRMGGEINEALAATGTYPRDFLDALEVGERSGRLPETMAILSQQYQERARGALATLTVLAGFAVWGAVALLIVLLIFRLMMFYVGTIYDALEY